MYFRWPALHILLSSFHLVQTEQLGGEAAIEKNELHMPVFRLPASSVLLSASVPGYEAVVGRPLEVEVKAFSEEGRAVSFMAKGWQARQIQHAVDMLNGVLYVDRMETKSFRRDKVEEDLPEGVPYGVRAAKVPRSRPKSSTGKRSARARR
eukprot:s506_g24.t1